MTDPDTPITRGSNSPELRGREVGGRAVSYLLYLLRTHLKVAVAVARQQTARQQEAATPPSHGQHSTAQHSQDCLVKAQLARCAIHHRRCWEYCTSSARWYSSGASLRPLSRVCSRALARSQAYSAFPHMPQPEQREVSRRGYA